jgi:phosphatidyl-myo-inositol alpha-mannosyltransferase
VRIGIVTEYCRPWPGGIAEHVHHEALELRRRGHTVTVLTGGPALGQAGDDDPHTIRLGRAVTFNSNGALSRLAIGPFLLGMRKLLARLRLDVLHVHAPLDPCLPLAATYAAPCPVVGTFHASFDRSALFDAIYQYNPIALRAFQRLRGRIAVSDEARRSITRYFPADYSIIPNGVDLARFTPGRQQGGVARRLLFVGRPDPRKGLPLLLAAHAALVERGHAVELTLAGVSREQAARHTSRYPERVQRSIHALGYVTASQLPAVYQAADLVCSPATTGESQGIVLLEAMASERACVCFDIAGYRDVVRHEQTGLIVEPCSVPALTTALQRLLQDAPLRARMARAGRIEAEHYAWPGVAASLEGQLLAAAKSR